MAEVDALRLELAALKGEQGYCRDCRWWERDHQRVGQYEARRCLMGSTDMPNQVALFWGLSDGSYVAEVETMPEFGCVQFAARRRRTKR